MADLKKQGAAALTDAQLKALIVGNSIWLRKTVTGEQFKVVYDTGGQQIVYHVNSTVPLPSEVGDVAQSGYLGTSQAYWIRNGRIVTSLADTPFEVTVYKTGDQHLAARSNEFGYANYEVMQKPPVNLVDLGKEVHVPPETEHAPQ